MFGRLVSAHSRVTAIALLSIFYIISSLGAQPLIGTSQTWERSDFKGDTVVVVTVEGEVRPEAYWRSSLDYVVHNFITATGTLKRLSTSSNTVRTNCYPKRVRLYSDHFTVYGEILNQDSISMSALRVNYTYEGNIIDSTRWHVPMQFRIIRQSRQTAASFNEVGIHLYFAPTFVNLTGPSGNFAYILSDTGLVSTHALPGGYQANHDALILSGKYFITGAGTAMNTPVIHPGIDQLEAVPTSYDTFEFNTPETHFNRVRTPWDTYLNQELYRDHVYAWGTSGTATYENRIGELERAEVGVMALKYDTTTFAIVDTAVFFRDYRLDAVRSRMDVWRHGTVDREGRFFVGILGRGIHEDEGYYFYLARHDDQLEVAWETRIEVQYNPRDIIPVSGDSVWVMANGFEYDPGLDYSYLTLYAYLVGPDGLISATPVSRAPVASVGRAAPNPVGANLRIVDLPDDLAARATTVELHDVSGRRVHAADYDHGGTVDTRDLPAGTYLAVLLDEAGAALTAIRFQRQ